MLSSANSHIHKQNMEDTEVTFSLVSHMLALSEQFLIQNQGQYKKCWIVVEFEGYHNGRVLPLVHQEEHTELF